MSTAEIEIVIGEAAFSIVKDGEEFLILTVDPLTQNVCVNAPRFDDIEWIDEMDVMPTPELKVRVREPRQKLTRLRPVPETEAVRTPTAKAKPKTAILPKTGTYVSPLEEWQRDTVLEMVVESWAQYPNQDKSFTASESHRIATEVFGDDTRTNVMRVAGIRAWLTRGAYEHTLEEMIEAKDKKGVAHAGHAG